MAIVELYGKHLQIKKEGKDQESILSSTTPDPGHRIGKWQNTRKRRIKTSHKRETRGQPFPIR